MRKTAFIIPLAALAMALGAYPAEAQRANQNQERSRDDQRAERRSGAREGQRTEGRRPEARGAQRSESAQRSERADRGNQSSGRERASASSQRRDNNQVNRAPSSRAREYQRDRNTASRDSSYRGNRSRDIDRSRDVRRDYDRGRSYDRSRSYDRGRSYVRGGYSRGYYAPRLLPRRYAPRHSYYSGGRLTLYFGIGSGYRYGSPYSGRVYGYRGAAPAYGAYRHYGDVRLKVSPRHAAVYVDGYYAGIVDDFDGFFQRLTLEVGPHEIEIEAPGFEPLVYDVYVDPSRTVDLHGDLRR